MIKSIINLIKKYQQFFRYCIGGAISFIVDFGLLYFLTEYANLWYLWSANFSFLVSSFVNYLIQRFWTFQSEESRVLRQFFIFLAVQTVGLFINNVIMYTLVEYFSIWYIFAKVLAALIVLIWNFWASRMFVFNKKFITGVKEIVIADEYISKKVDHLASYTHRIAKYFIDNGYQVKIIYCSDSKKKSTHHKNIYKIIKISNKLNPFIKFIIYFIKLINISTSAKVIYAQGTVLSGFPSLIVSKILHKRLVVKVSDDYCWHQAQIKKVTKKSIDDWQQNPSFNDSNLLVNFELRLFNFIQRLVVKNANQIIVPSYYLKKVVMGWGVHPRYIKVIYNSIKFDKIKRYTKQEAQKSINIFGDILLTGGQLMPWKGFSMLIDLMPELKKINPKFKLIIFGDGPIKNELTKAIYRNKLNQDVFLVGYIPHSQLYRYYQAASLFVLNTGYEGLSHILLDAMYYNIPTIVTNSGGNPELIQDDYNGILVDYNSKYKWIKAIERLWNNLDLRKRLCENPLVKLNIFNFNHMMEETIKTLFTKE